MPPGVIVTMGVSTFELKTKHASYFMNRHKRQQFLPVHASPHHRGLMLKADKSTKLLQIHCANEEAVIPSGQGTSHSYRVLKRKSNQRGSVETISVSTS